MPRSPFVTGYVTRVRRGSCASRPGQLGLSGFAKPGQTVTTDVIPEGDPFAGAAGDYCLSVWSQGDFDRVGSSPLRVRFHWAPDAIPAPASLSAQQSQGAVTLTWPEVHHEELAGFKVDWAGGTASPRSARRDGGVRSVRRLRRPGLPRAARADLLRDLEHRPQRPPQRHAGDGRPEPRRVPGAVRDVHAGLRLRRRRRSLGDDPVRGHVHRLRRPRRQLGVGFFGDPDSGSANASTSPSPAHTYAQVGDYTVTLTVTDEDGLTSQAVGGVSISSP